MAGLQKHWRIFTEVTRSTWNRDGIIVFGTNGGGLRKVSASGGDAPDITELDKSLEESGHNTPWFLPDGRHFLYTAWSAKPENRAIYVGSLDSKTKKRLMTAESKTIYASGFLLFMRDRALMARPFDITRLEFTGEAKPVAEDVAYNPIIGQSAFYASENGTLIYRRATAPLANQQQWSWVDRRGKTTGTVNIPANAVPDFRLSPDGQRLVFFNFVAPALDQNNVDVWIYDVVRNLATRLTTDAARDTYPVWSPDGNRVVFASDRGNPPAQTALYEKQANGAVPERLLLQSEPDMHFRARDWSLDGQRIVLEKFRISQPNQRDLWILPLSGDRKPFPYLATAADEWGPSLSPNGRWLAYVSNESGTYQIIVQSFPDPSRGKWQVSTKGGTVPRWRRDGRELYYLDPERQIVAVSVMADGDFKVGESATLFRTPVVSSAAGLSVEVSYDVTADGRSFLIALPFQSAPSASSAPITVISNWTSVLKH
jgi:Tol biopolymer transport system component